MPRPKKPTALRLLQGNPGKRPIPKHEAKPESTDYDAPEHLNGEALKEWNRIAPLLFDAGLFSNIDKQELENYCICVANKIEALKHIEQDGHVIETTNGNIIQSPWVGILNQAMLNAHKFLVEYGMTPASRSKVTVEKSTKENRFAKFG